MHAMLCARSLRVTSLAVQKYHCESHHKSGVIPLQNLHMLHKDFAEDCAPDSPQILPPTLRG